MPTNILRASGQLSFASGSHLFKALLNDFGSVNEKQIRKRSVLGYDKGLNLLYSSWPAVSQSYKLTIFSPLLIVAT